MCKRQTYYYLKSTGISKLDVDLIIQRLYYQQIAHKKLLSIYYWIVQVGSKFRLHAFIKNVDGINIERILWTVIVRNEDDWHAPITKNPKLLSFDEMKTLTSTLSNAYPKKLKVFPALDQPLPKDLPKDTYIMQCNYFKDMLFQQ